MRCYAGSWLQLHRGLSDMKVILVTDGVEDFTVDCGFCPLCMQLPEYRSLHVSYASQTFNEYCQNRKEPLNGDT